MKKLLFLIPLMVSLISSAQIIRFIPSTKSHTVVVLIAEGSKTDDNFSKSSKGYMNNNSVSCTIVNKANIDSLESFICNSPYVCSNGVDSSETWSKQGSGAYYMIITADGSYLYLPSKHYMKFFGELRHKWRENKLDETVMGYLPEYVLLNTQ